CRIRRSTGPERLRRRYLPSLCGYQGDAREAEDDADDREGDEHAVGSVDLVAAAELALELAGAEGAVGDQGDPVEGEADAGGDGGPDPLGARPARGHAARHAH